MKKSKFFKVDPEFIQLAEEIPPALLKAAGRRAIRKMERQLKSNLSVLVGRKKITREQADKYRQLDLAEYVYCVTFQEDENMLFTTQNPTIVAQRKELEEVFGLNIMTPEEIVAMAE
jgi:hypothetical protein|tara:strand:- start:2495 stop:2845 length:351 start_codon:yes stop_codon:yes gene_type:complete